MTRKHFQALAEALRCSGASQETIEAVARVCEKHNPNFDWNRFDMACRSCYHSAEAYND